MGSGSRRRTAGRLLLWLIPLLVCGCSKKQVIREEPPRALVEEALLFLSAVQGNPVCMVVDIDKRRSSSLFSSPNTKWRDNAWLISPGVTTYLGAQKGKSKQGALAPVFSADDKLLFTTDKDEFLYYVPTSAEKILLLSEPLFADRVRSGEEEEIRYGRMPATLYLNNRTIEGRLFYERRAWVERPQKNRPGPFVGLEPGGRVFALWGPGGEFLYLEMAEESGKARFAVMQDRRGRWQETFQIQWTEPECAFSPESCSGGEGTFRLSIPAWNVEGSLERLDQVRISTEAVGGEAEEEGSAPERTFWTSLSAIPQAKGHRPAAFCLLKGSIWVEKSQRAMYGIGLLAKGP